MKNPNLQAVGTGGTPVSQKGFVLPALGASRDAVIVQLAAEAVVLGTYKFSRYLTGDDPSSPQQFDGLLMLPFTAFSSTCLTFGIIFTCLQSHA